MTTQPPDITDQIITDDHDIPNIEDIFNLDWTSLENDGIDFLNWVQDIPTTFITAQAKAVAGILHWTIWTEANVVDSLIDIAGYESVHIIPAMEALADWLISDTGVGTLKTAIGVGLLGGLSARTGLGGLVGKARDHQRRAGYVTEEELREQLEGAATKEDIGQAFIVETVDKLRSGEISLMLDAIWGTQRPDIRGLDPTC